MNESNKKLLSMQFQRFKFLSSLALVLKYNKEFVENHSNLSYIDSTSFRFQ